MVAPAEPKTVRHGAAWSAASPENAIQSGSEPASARREPDLLQYTAETRGCLPWMWNVPVGVAAEVTIGLRTTAFASWYAVTV